MPLSGAEGHALLRFVSRHVRLSPPVMQGCPGAPRLMIGGQSPRVPGCALTQRPVTRLQKRKTVPHADRTPGTGSGAAGRQDTRIACCRSSGKAPGCRPDAPDPRGANGLADQRPTQPLKPLGLPWPTPRRRRPTRGRPATGRPRRRQRPGRPLRGSRGAPTHSTRQISQTTLSTVPIALDRRTPTGFVGLARRQTHGNHANRAANDGP